MAYITVSVRGASDRVVVNDFEGVLNPNVVPAFMPKSIFDCTAALLN